ncbi:hypothetical protein B0H65DRAFT_136216 [Neurospora tetraspora]|uniref:Secreted protein n=1 Tax=Neurospora tetraspora TaxID=94610 RepID=A0AAE0JM73_9PEZI|nr:hypothetical protein B0H65DRAFT_136216 [Neurospora tetraspora]
MLSCLWRFVCLHLDVHVDVVLAFRSCSPVSCHFVEISDMVNVLGFFLFTSTLACMSCISFNMTRTWRAHGTKAEMQLMMGRAKNNLF